MPISQSQCVLLWLAVVSVSISQATSPQSSPKSFAFYYGSKPPLQELRAFDRVVLEPDHGSAFLEKLDTANSNEVCRWMAYVSVGEVHRTRDYYRKIPPTWILGKNAAWGSVVLDQTPKEWPDFFLLHVIEPLWKKGYRGFFLDVLDSYELQVQSPEERQRQMAGVIALIRRIKKAHPEMNLMLNRGFQLLPEIHDLVEAIAFESLFQGWDAAKSQFTEVNEPDRFYLMDKAKEILKTYQIPVIAIDYVPVTKRDLMRSTAERIGNIGLIPWVTTPALDAIGMGSVEVIPRKILMLYDGPEGMDIGELAIHRNADPMVTYLGYVPEHRDIREPPPKRSIVGEYAGIVCWLTSGRNVVSPAMNTWLVSQAAQGMKMVFWGQMPFSLTGPHADAFGIQSSRLKAKDTSVHLVKADSVMHFEMEPFPDPQSFQPLKLKAGRPLLQIASARSDTMVAAAYTPWGGFVLNPFVMRTIPQQKHDRWVVQPMEFIAQALQLPITPIPDITTENGMRMLMVHLDGDGFANQAEWVPHPYAGEVLEQEILNKYPYATTFSVIEAEVAPHGVYPEHSPKLIPIAKRILALPHIEVASHSYSHPFDWKKFARGGALGRENHLDVKGFQFGPDLMEREVNGSVAYINRELAPEGKACKVFLWSGNCNPDSRTVGLTYAAGLWNMNGGETLISASSDSWTGIAPIGIDKGGQYQVYAPNQNENMYTHEWTGPFYGYENVIKTFERTDKPIRFKPVDIYYHSYSGSKQASLRALEKVYEWVKVRDFNNIWVSEYVPKVLDFTNLSLSISGKDWLIRTQGSLNQFRIPTLMGYPDLQRSQGIIGFKDEDQVRYIHLASSESRLAITAKPPTQPYLISANGKLKDWKIDARRLSMTVTSHLDLVFSIGGATACRVEADRARIQGKSVNHGELLFRLPVRQAQIEVTCP